MNLALQIADDADASDDQIIRDILHTLRELLGMKVGFIAEFVDGKRVFRHVEADASFQPICAGQSDPLQMSYCKRVVDGTTPELVRDASEEPSVQDLPATTELPVGAHISVPIRFSDGQLYGTFCCFSDKPDSSLTERDLTTFRLFASFAGNILERQVAQERTREKLASRIQKVLAGQQFSVHYQPIVNVSESRLVGHEALARFAAEPLRSPDQWFHEALLVGLNEELELAVMSKALAALPLLPEDSYLALNVSPETLILGNVEEHLQHYPLDRIVLEVTEHSSVTDYESIERTLAPLRTQGLRLAVDDAGAGYASFRHILKLKPDIIKLDGTLVQEIDKDPSIQALAAALVYFAGQTGAKVVAECVETPSELNVLRRLQVNKVQGYLIGRPQPLSHYQAEGFWSA
jgi:EAL domain-containing protein (putative c-di-GMP-specific phosphodiesterase class I)